MESKVKQLHIRLDKDIYKLLKIKCANENSSLQDSVGNIIESIVKYSGKQPGIQNAEKLEILSIFKRCPVISCVDLYELESLAAAAEIHQYKKGSMIDNDGEMSYSFHIIKSGIVEVFKVAPSGKEYIIDIRCQGEIFGEASVLKAIPHCASTRALRNTEVVHIKRSDFLNFMVRNPAVAQRIAEMEFEKVNRLYESVMDLVAANANQRLIKLFCHLLKKCGNPLKFTHQEIAEMSGTTTETVTRVMTRLKKSKIISLHRGAVMILNEKKLQALNL